MLYYEQISSGTRGGGCSTDTAPFALKLESMLYGHNRRSASEASFSDKQLVITTGSGLTGMSKICRCMLFNGGESIGFCISLAEARHKSNA